MSELGLYLIRAKPRRHRSRGCASRGGLQRSAYSTRGSSNGSCKTTAASAARRTLLAFDKLRNALKLHYHLRDEAVGQIGEGEDADVSSPKSSSGYARALGERLGRHADQAKLAGRVARRCFSTTKG